MITVGIVIIGDPPVVLLRTQYRRRSARSGSIWEGEIMEETTKEAKERSRRMLEIETKKYPVALTTCPNCKEPVHFGAGVMEVSCPCGALCHRKAREVKN